MRIKNESRWLKDVLDNVGRIADGIVVLDDGSTDASPEICKTHPKVLDYHWQQETEVDEVRDKNRLLEMTLSHNPEWVLCHDGDELYEDSAPERISEAIRNCPDDVAILDVQFLYMWDDPQHYRCDGIYERIFHHRLFSLRNQDKAALSFRPTAHGANFHCESVPPNIKGRALEIDVKVKHLGYMHREDRIRKYRWYKKLDPLNADKGYYEHLLDQPGMRIEPWDERPYSPLAKNPTHDPKSVHSLKQEKKPDYYYANARRNIVDLVPMSARRVLDVGCGQGLTGGLLRSERHIEVVGLEIHPEIAEVAREHLSDVVCGDIESMDLPFPDYHFDCIILADVLEHFVDPWRALKKIVCYLANDGKIISSIPNIRNLGVIEKLVKGSWDYAEQGILDKTHLRFFTLRNMVALFDQAGLDAKLVEVVRDPVFENQNALPDKQRTVDLSYGSLVLKSVGAADYNELTAQQFILTGTFKESLKTGARARENRKVPLVSIIIPVYNNFFYTQQCLDSIFAVAETVEFEVIVVDDASTDNTSGKLKESDWPVRLVRQDHNGGFAKSCNAGARVARGKNLVFLNNDTVVLPGWLTAMQKCLEQDSTIGLVGNLQLFPESRFVQHAGIVCGPDAMLFSIYHNQLPGHHPAVNKAREFQFVAGSCFMIAKDFFFSLGGLDEAYLNSCEDVDLCLKVRKVGRKVFYCPQSKILHFESKSVQGHSKTDTNYQLFLKRWRSTLIRDDYLYFSQDGMLAQRPRENSEDRPVTVLIAPPRYFKEPHISGYTGFSKNLGLGYIAAVLKQAGLKVSIIDAFAEGIDQFAAEDRPNGRVFRCGLGTAKISDLIPANVGFIGISIPFSNVAPIAFELARDLKKRFAHAKVVLGGIHPSTFPVDSLREGVDYVIAGEGEKSMLALVRGMKPDSIPGLYWRDLNGNLRNSGQPSYLDKLDDLPFPAWDLLPMERYMQISPRGDKQHRSLSLVTSRGCPFSCKFCSVHPVAGFRWRARSAANVLDEIRQAVSRYGINHIEIEDDNFTIDKQRALKILMGLREIDPALTWSAHNGLRIDTLDAELLTAIKASGCVQLNLAIEHGCERVLKAMNKKLSLEKVRSVVEICGRIKLKTFGFCLVGYPGEDHEAFSESFLFYQDLMGLGLSIVAPFIVNAYPGTSLYNEALENRWLTPETDDQLFFLEDEFVSVTTEDFDQRTVRKRMAAMQLLNKDPKLNADQVLAAVAPGEKDHKMTTGSQHCVDVLKSRKEIYAARQMMRSRRISFAEASTAIDSGNLGPLRKIGDINKSWDVLKTLDFIEDKVPATGNVLDLGAFSSEMLCILHNLGYRNLFGIDINPNVRAMPHSDQIAYTEGNFHQTVYPDRSFDAVTAISVIEHGFDSHKILSEVSRILKPGGYFIASVDFWPQKLDTSGLQAFGMDWLIFSEDELRQLIIEAEKYGLFANGLKNLSAGETAVSWNNRQYTFAWFVLQKKPLRINTGPLTEVATSPQNEKIAFLSTFNQPCGIATHTRFVCDGLRSALNAGNGSSPDIIILAEAGADHFDDDPENVFRCWRRQNDDFTKALDIILAEKITVLHIQFQITLFANTAVISLVEQCQARGIKAFATFHSSENNLAFCAKLINKLDRAFVHLEQSAIRFIGYGADPEKIEIIPHGVLIDKEVTKIEVAKKSLKIPEQMALISSFGFFEPHKGVDVILQALPAVLERHPDALFAFLGGCNNKNAESVRYFNRCTALAHKLGISEKVMFAEGFVSEEMASRYLMAADVIVLNYTLNINEISGAAAFAMAHGRPLVTSATPAFKPLTNCTLQLSLDMDVARAVNLILDSPELSAYLVAQSRTFVENNSYEVLGSILLNEYGILHYN